MGRILDGCRINDNRPRCWAYFLGSVGAMALVIRALQGTKLICYKKGIYAAVLLDDTAIHDPNLGVILGTVLRKLDAEKRS